MLVHDRPSAPEEDAMASSDAAVEFLERSFRVQDAGATIQPFLALTGRGLLHPSNAGCENRWPTKAFVKE